MFLNHSGLHLIVVVICVSQMADDVDKFPFSIHVVSLMRCRFKSVAHFLVEWFSYCSVLKFVYIWDTGPW